MIVRSRIAWPLRWAVTAVVFGFLAALALWAFEFGKSIAGLDRSTKAELGELRAEVDRLRRENDQARTIADTADSLLKAERTAQDRLTAQLRQAESEKQTLQADLVFFQRLLPASEDAVQVRGLQVQSGGAPGLLRYQMLVAQNGKQLPEFEGRYEVLLSGLVDGKPWTVSGIAKPLKVRQVARIQGVIDHPAAAVIITVQARVIDAQGKTQASQTLRP